MRRSWQRNCKRGYRGTLKQFGESEVYVRDEKYIRGLLQLREEQAREDWNQMRRVYRERKICLVEGAKAQGREKWIRRQIKKIGKNFNRVYSEERLRHVDKIKFLVSKYKKRKKIIERRENRRELWIQRVAKGSETGRKLQKEVPNYGGESHG